MKNLILIFWVILSFQCSSMEMKANLERDVIISYSDLPVTSIGKFNRVKYDFIALWGLVNYNSDNVEKILEEELKKYPNAKGIKNLKIRSYNSSHNTNQIISPWGAIFSYSTYVAGFSYRNVWVRGEIF